MFFYNIYNLLFFEIFKLLTFDNIESLFLQCQNTSVAEFTAQVRLVILNIVATLSIKRISDAEISNETPSL